MKPLVYANFSLPPALRFKTEYMFLQMILPSNAKGPGLKKYFDFAVDVELYSLYHAGIWVCLINIQIVFMQYNTKQESLASRSKFSACQWTLLADTNF
jgi:hypothetical protein